MRRAPHVTWGWALLVMIFSVPALAGMDHSLAAAGTREPYSQLVDAIPTQWNLFTQPTLFSQGVGLPEWSVSPYHPASLAEPGVGNPNVVLLGQIVGLGQSGGADRNVFAVYDRLAELPIPIVLYFHPGGTPRQYITQPFERAEPRVVFQGGGGIGGGGSSGPADAPMVTPWVIPEPTSMALVGVGAMLWLRRKRTSTR